MHTATRLFLRVARPRARRSIPRAHLCGYGLYAPLNEAMLRARRGAAPSSAASSNRRWSILAEREAPPPSRPFRSTGSSSWFPTAAAFPPSALMPNSSRTARSGVPAIPKPRAAANTSAAIARSCLSTTARSASSSATWCLTISAARWPPGAEHITFGDPDFWNGPGHAMAHRRSLASPSVPALSYDVTIKVEHLLQHRDLLPVLRAPVARLSPPRSNRSTMRSWRNWPKATRAQIFCEALAARPRRRPDALPDLHSVYALDHAVGLPRLPSAIGDLDLVDAGGADPARHPPADPRGLAPARTAGGARPAPAIRSARPVLSLAQHPDPALDALCTAIQELIKRRSDAARRAAEIFRQIWDLAGAGRSRISARLARYDSVPHGALVLLSGAHGRAVSSCVTKWM